MFTLRRCSKDGLQINQVIGDSYTFIESELHFDRFREVFEHYFLKKFVVEADTKQEKDEENENGCYAFIINGSFLQPLYKQQRNYIMLSDGKTFDNVTFR